MLETWGGAGGSEEMQGIRSTPSLFGVGSGVEGGHMRVSHGDA